MPKFVENEVRVGRYGGHMSGDLTDEDCKKKWPEYAHLNNERYARIMGDYLACMSGYLHQFPYVEQLEKQLDRRDLDTVCAYELYQMKKSFNNENVLSLSSWHPPAQQ